MEDERPGISPSELEAILAKLDEVLKEAERLRMQIEQQMRDHRQRDQQKISRRPRRKRSS